MTVISKNSVNKYLDLRIKLKNKNQFYELHCYITWVFTICKLKIFKII